MFTRVRKFAGALVVGALIMGAASGLAPTAQAQNQQDADGLVNVQVGDVTILENVAVAAAVAAVANLCPAVNVSNVAVLAAVVDQRGGRSRAFCEGTAGAVTGPVTIVDNDDNGNGGGNQQTADGLVNVQVGDVTIAENVAVALAAGIVANVCPAVNLSNVAALALVVDQRGGASRAFCEGTADGATGPVKIVNN